MTLGETYMRSSHGEDFETYHRSTAAGPGA